MATTANRGAGALSRFAHFAGIVSKPKAGSDPATTDDVDEVKDDVDDVGDQVDDVKEDVKDLEDRVDDLETDDEEDDAADKDMPPAERTAYRKGVASGRKAERARSGTILSSPVAAKNRNLALHLAFESPLPAKQAVALLKASADGAPPVVKATKGVSTLDARMGTVKPVTVGTGAGASGPDMNTPQGLAAHAIAVAKRAGIVK